MFSFRVVGMAIKEMSPTIQATCLVPIVIGLMHFCFDLFGVLKPLPGKSLWSFLFFMGMISVICFVSYVVIFFIFKTSKTKRDRL